MTYIIGKRDQSVPYRIETLSETGMPPAIKEGEEIEPAYALQLLPLMPMDLNAIRDKKILLVTFGTNRVPGSTYYLDVERDKWERGEQPEGACVAICCYTAGRVITTPRYLQAAIELHELGQSLGRNVVMLIHGRSVLPYFRSHTLAQAVLSTCSRQYGSLLLYQEDLTEVETRGQGVRNWQQVMQQIEEWDHQEERLSSSQPLFQEIPLMTKIGHKGLGEGWLPYDFPYKGKGVYIGMITTEDENYDDPELQNADGSCRIVTLWEQIKGRKGVYKKAPYQKGKEGEAQDAQLLKLMGGTHQGLAREAEFIVAKIHQAPTRLCEQYGAPLQAVKVSDVKIAIEKLSRLAAGKPLILLLTYSCFQSIHLTYQDWLERFAAKKGHLVVIPAGDEADKNKHYICCQKETQKESLKLPLSHPLKRVVGRAVVKEGRFFDLSLQGPDGSIVSLVCPGKFVLGRSEVETEGSALNPQTGNEEIRWQVYGMMEGVWLLTASKMQSNLGVVEISLECEEAEAFSACKQATCKGTLIPLKGEAMIQTGCFREKDQVLYGFSGRGEATHLPTLVVGDSLMLGQMESTLEAACLTAATAACLYEKLTDGQKDNRLYPAQLKQTLCLALERLPDFDYPQEGQGYGILSQKVIACLLGKE